MNFSWLTKIKFPFTKPPVASVNENLENARAIFYAILDAIEKNPVHSKEDGVTGIMFATWETSRNGDHNSFCVFLPGNHSISGLRYARKYFALQFDIDVCREGEEILILLDRQGRPLRISLLDFDYGLTLACTHIQDWRLQEQKT